MRCGLVLACILFATSGACAQTATVRDAQGVPHQVARSQFFLDPGGPGCPHQHFHAENGVFVTALDGTQIDDPAPDACGYGILVFSGGGSAGQHGPAFDMNVPGAAVPQVLNCSNGEGGPDESQWVNAPAEERTGMPEWGSPEWQAMIPEFGVMPPPVYPDEEAAAASLGEGPPPCNGPGNFRDLADITLQTDSGGQGKVEPTQEKKGPPKEGEWVYDPVNKVEGEPWAIHSHRTDKDSHTDVDVYFDSKGNPVRTVIGIHLNSGVDESTDMYWDKKHNITKINCLISKDGLKQGYVSVDIEHNKWSFDTFDEKGKYTGTETHDGMPE